MRAVLLPCVALMMLLAAAGLQSCGQREALNGPYLIDGRVQRDIPRAEKLYRQALDVIATDAKQAEQLLREALTFDLYHGGAHNNLGVLLVQQEKWYEASDEFEWARKLMPGHPEPRTNLALVLEHGGKHAEALESAQAALETSPGDLPAMQALASIQLREGLGDDKTLTYLDAIILRSSDPDWTTWARSERLSLETRLKQP